MTPDVDPQDRSAVAAAWVAREDRGQLEAGERGKRDAWLSADSRQFGAYARARAVSAQAARVAATMRAAETSHENIRVPRSVRRWLRSFGLAAMVAAAAWLAHMLFLATVPQTHEYRTSRGEVLRMPLPDGSMVTLDSATELTVIYTPDRRGIRLLRGEALFDVVSDRARPFVVSSAQATVTAVGTSFSVAAPQDAQDAVRVLVREGRVDLADTTDGVRQRVARLEANQTAAARPGAPIQVQRLQPKSVQDQLAWREGMLAFHGDTLATAARRFRRYSDVRIVIDEPTMEGRRVVGLYSANDPVGFARSVALSLGLVAERRGNTIHLRSPQQTSRGLD